MQLAKTLPKDPKSVSRLLRQNNDYYQSRIMDKVIHGKSTTGLLKDLLFLLHATSVKWRLHSRRTLCSCQQEEATTFKVQCFNTCCLGFEKPTTLPNANKVRQAKISNLIKSLILYIFYASGICEKDKRNCIHKNIKCNIYRSDFFRVCAKKEGFWVGSTAGIRKEALEKLHAGGLQILNALQTSRALTPWALVPAAVQC